MIPPRPRRQIPIEPSPVLLHRRRIYIIPDRFGLLFVLILLVMLVGSINYGISLGFVFTFLLGGILLVSILHTYRNMAGLQVIPGRTEPVFAGGIILFAVGVHNPTSLARFAIHLAWNQPEPALTSSNLVEVEPGQTAWVTLSAPAIRRGRQSAATIRLHTRYPLGWIHAWSLVRPEISVLVYPQPEERAPPLPTMAMDQSGQQAGGEGGDDFHGLRLYRTGDSWRHIHWKAAAGRTDVWQVKQFTGAVGGREILLDWEATAEVPTTEAKLSRLCRWILEAELQDWRYGLNLPGVQRPMDHGPQHQKNCLEALALFDAATVPFGT